MTTITKTTKLRTARRAALLGSVLATLLGTFTACAGKAPDDGADEAALEAYRQEIRDWQQGRQEGLTRQEGWLTVVGLHWLGEGETTVGSDPMSDVVLPANAPARVGTLVRRDGELELDVMPGVEAKVAGEPVRKIDLAADTSGEPTVVELGNLRFYHIRRGTWDGLRVRDLDSPALASFTGVDFFPIDPAWRVEASFEPYAEPKEVQIDDVTGNQQTMVSPGELVFQVDGQEQRLQAYKDEDGFFLIFADKTSGKETYGAGRYLGTGLPNDEGKVTLDFNKAYNPPCAFTPFATCPLPPKQNRLGIAVTAGEKVYRGESGH